VIRRGRLPHTVTDVPRFMRAISGHPGQSVDLILAHGAVCAAAAVLTQPEMPVAFVFHASAFREARQRRRAGLSVLDRLRSLCVEPFLYVYERIALRRANRILVLSEFSRGLIRDIEPVAAGRARRVGGGVDIRRFIPAGDRATLRARAEVEDEEIVLMTARRLVSRTGVGLLLDAFAILHKRHPEMRLVVVGEGELRRPLERYRAQRGLDSVVRFTGGITDEQLLNWYRLADVFVLPTVAYEGFGMVTAEALACGTPVVATPVGASREVLAPLDARLIANAVSDVSLAAAIEDLVGRLDTELRQRCRTYAESCLSWDAVIERWEAALSSTQSEQACGRHAF